MAPVSLDYHHKVYAGVCEDRAGSTGDDGPGVVMTLLAVGVIPWRRYPGIAAGGSLR